jgi:oxidoreductase, Fe-S type
MPTFLFHDTVFGPVHSRRLGVSLGVNLLPTDSKFCNFNCIYCECGWTGHGGMPKLPPKKLVHSLLLERLQGMANEGKRLDAITFAGNGEPTIHPDFAEIIDFTLEARNRLAPGAKVVVLSNATMLHHPRVANALRRVDQAALKLDSAIDTTLQLIDGPQMPLTARQVMDRLLAFGHSYTLQTLFLRGEYSGKRVDNTTPAEVEAWLAAVQELRPKDVMVYTIDRDTPAAGLQKAPLEVLEAIAMRVERLGIPAQVSG